jgi:DHA2 family multidrug resistance protein
MLVLRGIALGLTVQPLTVFGLSEVKPRQLAQASSMNTVMRSVSSSLGIAVLATLVQSQTKVHFARLAEQVTASSQLGQLLPRLQALFVARGAGQAAAQSAALQVVSRLVQRQSFVLAIQDAFLVTVVIIGLAIISVLFVRGSRRKPATIPEAAPAATGVPAEEGESSTPAFAMVE